LVVAGWRPGEVVVRREVIGLDVDGLAEPGARVWFSYPVHVVHDRGEELVCFVGPGAEFGFVDGQWPTATGRHPWSAQAAWEGHGCLMVQRRGDPYAVWHYWHGPQREFLCWYVNFQAPFRRTSLGFDTQDFELDLVVFADGSWVFKDLDVLPARVEEGYLSAGVAERVRRLGDEIAVELDAGHHRWDPRWAEWVPPARWHGAARRPGWAG
jgi:Protein of unknown function (DUF402)